MTSPYPLADLSLAWRFLLAMAVQVFAPGWLLVGRRLTAWDGLSRAYAALVSGLLLQPLLALILSFARVPLSGWLLGGAAVVVALGLDRLAGWRQAVAAIAAGIRPARRIETWAVGAATCASLAVVLRGFAGFSAPSHLYDASNHAYLALRILATRSLDPERLLGAVSGHLPLPYLLGWHVTAATSCDLSGLAPYVACWYLSVLAVALLPAGLNLLWRAANVGPGVAAVAAALAAANFWVPAGLYSWGGLGMILGLAMMPWAVVVARAAIRRPGATSGAMAAAALVALLHVHTSEVFTACALLVVVWPAAGERRPGRRDRARAGLAAAGVLLLGGLLPVLPSVAAYTGTIAALAAEPRPRLAELGNDLLYAAGGGAPLLRWLAPLGLLAILMPARRRLAVAVLAVVVVYVGLRWFHDPLSGALTQPYYRQWPRLLYGLIFLLPPLVATMLALPTARLAPRVPRRILVAASVGGLAALLVLGVWPGLRHASRNLANQRVSAPLDGADVTLARQLADLQPRDGVVANLEADGSFWIMHASGRAFLDPCGWDILAASEHPWRALVPLLGQRPWPPQVRAMQAANVAFLLVSDHLVAGAATLLSRAELARDPRFEVALTNDRTTLYRIRWDAEP